MIKSKENFRYHLDFWQTRKELEEKGVFKPANEMIKRGMLPKKSYSNILLGRIIDNDFLNKLKQLNKLIK